MSEGRKRRSGTLSTARLGVPLFRLMSVNGPEQEKQPESSETCFARVQLVSLALHAAATA
jgi:hypothetical protein